MPLPLRRMPSRARAAFRANFRGFAADRGGSLLVWFAVALVPLAVAVGAGLDYGRAVNLRTRLQNATDAAALEEFPDDARLHRWIPLAKARVPFQGLPARICWLGHGERARGAERLRAAQLVGGEGARLLVSAHIGQYERRRRSPGRWSAA